MPAVAADVQEGAELAVARACNYYGNLAGDGGEVRTVVTELPRVAGVLPGAGEDPLTLSPQDVGIGVPRPGKRRLHRDEATPRCKSRRSAIAAAATRTPIAAPASTSDG